MISVVIPSYNGARRIGRTLDSVRDAAAACAEDVEVVVVDNGSWDDTAAAVARHAPSARVVRLDPNRGFGGGVQAGVEAAQGRLVALVSDDFLLEADVLEKLRRHFERPDTFAVMPRVLNMPGEDLDVLPFVPRVRHGRLRYKKLAALPEGVAGPLPVLFVGGGMGLFDRERFLALGGFHPIYLPGYIEDIDLSLRAWGRGWSCSYDPSTSVRHCHEEGAFATMYRRLSREALITRNWALVGLVNLDQSVAGQLLWLGVRAVQRLFTRPHRALALWLSLPGVLRRLPAALALRRQERRLRVRDNRAVFQPLIEFWRDPTAGANPALARAESTERSSA